jgi:hypothetical protein
VTVGEGERAIDVEETHHLAAPGGEGYTCFPPIRQPTRIAAYPGASVFASTG